MYPDGRGGWYFKVTLGSDPLTAKRVQITKRGYRTAGEASRERREVDSGQLRLSSKLMTVNELLDLYLHGLDADGRLAPKTRFDYRNYSESYIPPVARHSAGAGHHAR
ncbi:MAG TPA: Arm DNA-binding domain-containing protein, partial [Acidimicrobiales bacterium]|nr:Arm DNA-binding domain-containing protein [Acidimicrobiales bacterium]